MNYPGDFDTRTFPAGKSIAISRAMGIGILSAFFIILCLCGLLVWTIRSARVEPFIITTGGINDQWRVVMAGGENPAMQMTEPQVFQQSLVWRFARNWFGISPNHDTNAAIWATDCKREYCVSDIADTRRCAIFCATSDEQFRRFSENVLPQYKELQNTGSTWFPVPDSMRIDPVGRVTDAGGTWRVQLTILTDGATGAIDIVAFAKVARATKYYSKTMGYYINDFNAYRVSQ